MRGSEISAAIAQSERQKGRAGGAGSDQQLDGDAMGAIQQQVGRSYRRRQEGEGGGSSGCWEESGGDMSNVEAARRERGHVFLRFPSLPALGKR